MQRDIDIVTGFFESGKSSFINRHLSKVCTKNSLVISSERGFVSCDGVETVYIDDLSEVNPILDSYNPDYVILEYNGFWGLDDVLSFNFSQGFVLRNIISLIDLSTFDNYIQNMPKVILEKVRNSDLVILNSKGKLVDDLPARKLVKEVNPACKVIEFSKFKSSFINSWITSSDSEILKLCLLIFGFYGIYFGLKFLNPVFFDNEFKKIIGIALSLIIQILPFLMLGAVLSSIIQAGIKMNRVEGIFKKTGVVNIFLASVLGIFFPVCDCAMVPIASSLIKKEYSIPVVFTFLIASPALNPIVIISTYYAFYDLPYMVVYRSLATILIAWILGAVLFYLERSGSLNPKDVLKERFSYSYSDIWEFDSKKRLSFLDKVVYHTRREFFRIGSFVIVGAFLSASVQVLVSKQVFISLNQVNFLAVISMIIASFFISVCSTSNAFIGRGFLNAMPLNSILGFLVMGPIFDITNLSAMFSVFKKKFLIKLILSLMYLSFIGFSLLRGFNI